MGSGYSILALPQWHHEGKKLYGRRGFERASERWDVNELEVDVTGKVYAITGPTSGLGKQVAREIARRGGTVHLLCRNQEKGELVRFEIEQDTGSSNVHLHIVNVAEAASVREFAERFLASGAELHGLINNAGVLPVERRVTSDMLEEAFATMAGGTYLLTGLLLPALKRGAPSRVINVSSAGMYTTALHPDEFNMESTEYSGTLAYARAKRAQVALTETWADKLRGTGIVVNSMHPGWVDTPGLRRSMPDFVEKHKDDLRTVEMGADTILWLTLSPAADRRSGSFFFDREPRRNAMPLSGTAPSDSVKARLWAFCAHKFLWDFDPDRAFDYDAALTALKTRAHLLASDMQLESAGVVRSDEGREQA